MNQRDICTLSVQLSAIQALVRRIEVETTPLFAENDTPGEIAAQTVYCAFLSATAAGFDLGNEVAKWLNKC